MNDQKIAKALRVLVLDPGIRRWLIETDPQALNQAMDALELPHPDYTIRSK